MVDTKELDNELQRLNDAVKDAVDIRTKWMDDNMQNYTKFKVGDKIYNGETGKYLGVVSKLYRYWGGGRDPWCDTSMNIHLEYTTPEGYGDNTSRHYVYPCTKEEMIRRKKFEVEMLENEDKYSENLFND